LILKIKTFQRYEDIADEAEREALLATITKEEKTFQQTAYELLLTETDYINDLKILQQVLPLLDSFE